MPTKTEKLAIKYLTSKGIPTVSGREHWSSELIDIIAFDYVAIEVKYSKAKGGGIRGTPYRFDFTFTPRQLDKLRANVIMFICDDIEASIWHSGLSIHLFDAKEVKLSKVLSFYPDDRERGELTPERMQRALNNLEPVYHYKEKLKQYYRPA